MNFEKNSNALLLIPTFNEAKNISRLLDEISLYFEEVLVVDDCSEDNTVILISDKNIKIISHLINLGQGGALETGFIYFLNNTNLEYIVTFDGDGQHRVKDAYNMINYAKDFKLDAVIGSRFLTKKAIKKIPFSKKLTLRLARIYESIFFSINLTDAHNGLRVLSRKVVNKNILPIRNYDMSHATEISGKICNGNVRFKEFPVIINYENKKSQKPINAINILINFLFKRQ
tara:strand:- start:1185 stop:1874 length:690 start_codon:yes stop_codon:yes gene_type:complete